MHVPRDGSFADPILKANFVDLVPVEPWMRRLMALQQDNITEMPAIEEECLEWERSCAEALMPLPPNRRLRYRRLALDLRWCSALRLFLLASIGTRPGRIPGYDFTHEEIGM